MVALGNPMWSRHWVRSDVETRLVAAARRGIELVCSNLQPEQLRESTDVAHVVRAELIRVLLLGREFGELDPAGVRLRGARLTGMLDLSYVQAITGLHLADCVIEQRILLRDAHLPRLEVVGCHTAGLLGNGLQVAGSMSLCSGFTATGDGEKGTVQLLGAHVGGDLRLTNAALTSHCGPALDCGRLRVDGGMFLTENFTATGHSDLGAVRMMGAHVGGDLDLRGATLTNRRPLVLDLGNVDASSVRLSAVVVCPSHASTLAECPTPDRQIDIGGLTYTSISDVSWDEWLHIIRRHTPRYMPMPYQQLVARQKAAGHDQEARRTLIAQQRDLRARGQIGGPGRRAMHWLWGALAGYGYRAGRTGLALLVVLALAGGTGWWAGHTVTGPGQHAAQHTKADLHPGTACSSLEQIGLGIDRGLPLGTTGVRAYCDLNISTTAGEWFTLAVWVLQALIWALATLAIAGYTGLVRKIT